MFTWYYFFELSGRYLHLYQDIVREMFSSVVKCGNQVGCLTCSGEKVCYLNWETTVLHFIGQLNFSNEKFCTIVVSDVLLNGDTELSRSWVAQGIC